MHPRLRSLPTLCAFIFLAQSSFPADPAQIALGKKTAEALCQSCHLQPAPSLLDQETWIKHALPYMKPWLGRIRIEPRSPAEANHIRQAGVFPDKPVLTNEQWDALNAYYQATAPELIAPTNKLVTKTNSKLFRPRPLQTSTNIPATTLLQIDTNSRALYIGDAQERTLKLVSPQGDTLRSITLPSAPVAAINIGTNLWVPIIGRTFPSDEWAGQLRRFTAMANTWESVTVLANLPRLVHASIADLNADTKPDFILCGFGHRVGKLMLWQQPNSTAQHTETVLSPFPGAIATHIEDLDADGAPDILLLRGAAREGVFAFYNRGDHFEEKPVIEFQPTYGTSQWQILDFNRDGKTDLLISNGDIGDYPAKPRPYHGLRLYFGQGQGRFLEAWSFPLNGAYGMRAADFDNDGDLDIAAISFFPDFKNYPDESFLYLENKGSLTFDAYTFPFTKQGRWLVMDAADLDGDSDIDIALGSFASGPRTIFLPDDIATTWRTNRLNVLLLENTTR